MRFYIETYGCTANKADESIIKGAIKEKNHEIVKNIKDSDVIIILTCTVIDTTQQRMISKIKSFKKTGKKLIVAGCMASIQKDEIKKFAPNALFLPPQYSDQILDLLKNGRIKEKKINKTKNTKDFENFSAPIAIAEGCMFNCSYCITTLARGKLNSFPINEIVKDIKNAVNMGCFEIQLTSQDTSSYGLDKKTNLGKLLLEIHKIKKDFKLRVGMMNPYTCNLNIDSIINGFDDNKIYKFLHLPIQSGNDNILELMNRKYKVNDAKNIITKFREKYPDITLSTDIIVAFPSETENQFEDTIKLIKNIKPDITNITRYSARPFTKAKHLKGRVKTEIAKKRSKILTDLCKEISKEKNKKFIGKKFEIRIYQKGKNKTFIARNENYKPVVVNKKLKIGQKINLEIIDYEVSYLVGSII